MRRLLLIGLALILLTTTVRAALLPDELRDVLPEALSEAAEDGNLLTDGIDWLRETARAELGGILRDSTRNAALLMLVALLCGAAEGLAGGAGEMASRYVPYCAVLATAALAAGDLRSLIGLGAQTVEELGTLAKLLLPTLAASMAAGGFVTTASVWQVTTLLVCDVLCTAASRWLLPLTYCHIAASAAGAAMGQKQLETLADGLKKLLTGALKLAMVAFTSYLAVAGVLTGSADRTAVKAAKVVVAGAIPVVGGVLSDATESVLAAAGTLRGTIGAVGVLAVGAVCLTPLLRLGVQFLLYKLAAFAAGLAGTKTLSGFLDRLGEAFALVFAMTAACALVLLVALLVAMTMAVG